jgi:DNA repair exonuclease SbcCD nuclease subunit
MAISLLLTSDFHLGMRFASYPDVAARVLGEARFSCLGRAVAGANAAQSDLLVVAGDLFESVRTPVRDVQRAAEILRGFQGRLAVVMPGNHDYFAPDDSLWRRFRDFSGDSVLLLDQPRPYPLSRYDVDACLYPGPCTAKHSGENAVDWVASARQDRGIRHHIGIAHGSLEGYSPDMDGRYYPMRPQELLAAGMQLWLLGHTHVRFPAAPGPGDRIFCAGTPEPDGLDCAHEGFAWHLSVGDNSAVSARAERVGRLRFKEITVRVREGAEIEQALVPLLADAPEATVLRLHLEGRAPREVRESVGALAARLSERFLHAEVRDEELELEITEAEIDRDYPQGSFPHSLLTRLAGSRDHDALQAAHELLREARS